MSALDFWFRALDTRKQKPGDRNTCEHAGGVEIYNTLTWFRKAGNDTYKANVPPSTCFHFIFDGLDGVVTISFSCWRLIGSQDRPHKSRPIPEPVEYRGRQPLYPPRGKHNINEQWPFQCPNWRPLQWLALQLPSRFICLPITCNIN
ncbi:uncharacterized protein EI90DRAFT_2064956 [Cantharellus anzutake]|uniref:uncharacterized protein n=1 Tax=Cantharellus anzutake TaxID=1750568 RepID=UPI001904A415|nr:uncharacterized protein EI90DRAFT_2064956 [Cantharellus anzutake]KAF8340451.1 hypothetical protein EI90DRAFT_2064956 [Cantharellus anzutake]